MSPDHKRRGVPLSYDTVATVLNNVLPPAVVRHGTCRYYVYHSREHYNQNTVTTTTSIDMSISSSRTQIRRLESQLAELLSEYSSFATSHSVAATEDESRVGRDIEQVIEKTADSLDSFERLLDSTPNATATQTGQLQRHRETLAEHRSQYKKINAGIKQERDRANLLSSVRSDIEGHRNRSATPQAEEEYMLHERGRVDNSNNMTDTLLAQAYATREELMTQRASLANIQRRLFNTASSIPGINTVISKINTRKKRDSLILAVIITLGILFIFFLR